MSTRTLAIWTTALAATALVLSARRGNERHRFSAFARAAPEPARHHDHRRRSLRG